VNQPASRMMVKRTNTLIIILPVRPFSRIYFTMIDHLLIHIGYHKTGSTWLQQELFIRSNTVFEPFSRIRRGHSSLARFFYKDEEGYLLSPLEKKLKKVETEVDFLSNHPKMNFSTRVPVLSDERLSGNPHSGGFDSRSIADRLKAAFPKASILIVIREQGDALLSSYFQFLSKGGTDSFHQYLNRPYDGRRPGFSPAHFNYLPLIQYYQQLFGPEKVCTLLYEDFRDSPRIFLEKLGKFIGREIPMEEERISRVHNHHTHKLAMYRFRKMNSFIHKDSLNGFSPWQHPKTSTAILHFRNSLGRLFGQKGEEKLLEKLRTEARSFAQSRYPRPNKELSQLLDLDLSQYGYH
jgi:hypothetical protein